MELKERQRVIGLILGGNGQSVAILTIVVKFETFRIKFIKVQKSSTKNKVQTSSKISKDSFIAKVSPGLHLKTIQC